MYDSILVPTDGSPEMHGVVDHAAGLARAHDATLAGIYVIDTTSLATLPMDTAVATVRQSLEEEGQTALERMDEWAEDVAVEHRIVDGTPWREIVSYAEEIGADLVVMGTHGRGGLDRLLLGSVAERVVRRSPVPVLTVRVESGVENPA